MASEDRQPAVSAKQFSALDKKVALLAKDLSYVKGSVDDQKTLQKETSTAVGTLSDSIRNLKVVTPEALSTYVTTHEKVHDGIVTELADHDKWIKELQSAAIAEKNTYFSRLRKKIGDRAVDIGLTLFYLVIAFVLLQLLTGGGVFKNLLNTVNP